MGQKIHPGGLRVGVIHDWKSNWYTGKKEFADYILEDVRIREHIHQMRDRRALITADIGNARLQQGFGNGEDAFASEGVAFSKPEILDFASKRPFSHCALQKYALS